jgi:hypothetical protein
MSEDLGVRANVNIDECNSFVFVKHIIKRGLLRHVPAKMPIDESEKRELQRKLAIAQTEVEMGTDYGINEMAELIDNVASFAVAIQVMCLCYIVTMLHLLQTCGYCMCYTCNVSSARQLFEYNKDINTKIGERVFQMHKYCCFVISL